MLFFKVERPNFYNKMQHFFMPALTYVLISSADSFCVSLVSFTVCCREFPHSWFLLAATVLVE